MKNKILNQLKQLVMQEPSCKKLVISFCVGNYVAFSPYPFPLGHTLLAFLLSYIFRLNTAVVFFATFFINNPWTALVVYGLDYAVGYWLVHQVAGVSPINPAWMNFINNFLQQKIACGHFCLWSFLIGGNLLGIVTSVMLYPILKSIVIQLYPTTNRVHESNHTKQKSIFRL